MANEFDVFVTGGTGYMGSRLISTLVGRGHRVSALACRTSLGDALDAESVFTALRSGTRLFTWQPFSGRGMCLGRATVADVVGAVV